MRQEDFFDITGVKFDPPETNGAKIASAIKAAEASIGSSLGKAHESERAVLNAKLSALAKWRESYLDGTKPSGEFVRAANDRRSWEIKRLETLISMDKGTRSVLSITMAKIRSTAATMGLERKTVEAVYSSNGYKVMKKNLMEGMPKFPTNASQTYDSLAQLRTMRDMNPNAADNTIVKDLYDFAAYTQGEPERGFEYRSMPTSALKALMADYARANSMRTDQLGSLCKKIASSATTTVFSSEDARTSYENYLLYRSEPIEELFSMMDAVSESDLRRQSFAAECIRRIAEVFGDTDAAIAIYNDHAGFSADPVGLEEYSFPIKCASCGREAKFASVDEAKSVNKCPSCGKPYYAKCTSCGDMVPVGSERCPSCGFVFGNKALYAKYLETARQAFASGNIDAAKMQIVLAEGVASAQDSSSGEFKSLKARIDGEAKKAAAALDAIRSAMGRKMYSEASSALAAAASAGKASASTLEPMRREIRRVLDSCSERMSLARKSPQSKASSICCDILDDCADYAPALEYLETVPPSAPSALQAGFDEAGTAIVLAWPATGERNVSYTVVRKSGSNPPITDRDGTVVASGLKACSCNDRDAKPGEPYAYSVFSTRNRLQSKPVSVTVCLLSPPTSLRCTQTGNKISVYWDLPDSADGASAAYTVDSVQRNIPCSARSASIGDISYGRKYRVSVRAVYSGRGSSKPAVAEITPTRRISKFSISCDEAAGASCKVKWDITDPGVLIRVFKDGKLAVTASSDHRYASVPLDRNKTVVITAQASSEGSWVKSSNSISISTYEAAQIDPGSILLREHEGGNSVFISFSLKSVPQNAIGFYCCIRTKARASDPPPWARVDDLANEQVTFTGNYKMSGTIERRMTTGDEDAYYITVYTVYDDNGTIRLSEPSKRRVVRPLSISALWSAKKPFLGTGKLKLRFEANRIMYDLPEYVLCASTDGKAVHDPNGTNSRVVAMGGGGVLDNPANSITIEQEITQDVRKGTRMFLFCHDATGEIAPRFDGGFDGTYR